MRQPRYLEDITGDVIPHRYITELTYRFSVGRDLLPATDTNVQLRKSYSLPFDLKYRLVHPAKETNCTSSSSFVFLPAYPLH